MPLGLKAMKIFARLFIYFRTHSFADWGKRVGCGEERWICPRLAVSSWAGHSIEMQTTRNQDFASGQVWVETEKSSVAKGTSSLMFDLLDLRAHLVPVPRLAL